MRTDHDIHRGFTLIEILIVVAIIAILAAVVLVGLGPTQEAGRDARRISDLQEVQNGLELYYNACGYYPGDSLGGSSFGVWNICLGGYTPIGGGSDGNGVDGYQDMSQVLDSAMLGINSVPQDPGNHQYEYATAVPDSYTLGAQFENINNSAMANSLQGDSVNGMVGPGGTACGSNGFYCISL